MAKSTSVINYSNAISKQHNMKSTLIQQTMIPNITQAMNDANDVESTTWISPTTKDKAPTNDERQSTNQLQKNTNVERETNKRL
ncbi:24965_t:CDS:1, partial [Gigaspora rosea]